MSKNNLNNTMKKKIVLIFLILSVALILLYAAITFISRNLENWLYDIPEEEKITSPYEPNFDENIMLDANYLELDRRVYYNDNQTGVTVAVEDEKYSSYNEVVTFMYEYIKSIINGDIAFYNSCFNELYINAAGKKQPFTMQKLYDIEFSLIETGVDAASGKNYARVWIDYKIYENNLSFRNDIGSKVCRRQYLTLVKESGGEYKIQGVDSVYSKPEKTLKIGNAILFVLIMAAFVIGAIVAIVFTVKYSKKNGAHTKETEKTLS